MKTARFVALTVMAGLFALLWVAPAGAQDESPFSLTTDPATVPEAGTYDVTLTGEGFTADQISASFCPGAEGDIEAITPENFLNLCDLPSIQADDNTDGLVTLTFTGVEIPEEGLVWLAGDIVGQQEFASAVITVGADDGAADDGAADDGAADDGAADDGAADDGAADDGEDLPETGSESSLIAIVGVAILAAGVMMVGFGRRLGRL
ncbi:MAG: LPXTG cell wall anchor domain-containing protein [Acidimicrobiales bacterium]